MANITITVQSMLNTAVYDSYTISDTALISTLESNIQTATGCDTSWFSLVFNNEELDPTKTLAFYSIVGGSALRTANKIGRLGTRELRQKAKLDLSALDRVNLSNLRSTYDITELPTQYVDDTIYDNPNLGGLTEGRPWIDTQTPFTFYEAINTTSALYTTQYVSGNKIYAYSSSFDVPSFQPARVIVNDIEVLTGGAGTRGHHAAVLNSNGDVQATYNFDTYNDPNALSALATALNAVPSGNIVVLVVYDASAFDAACRLALTTGYGCTNNNQWTPSRFDHIFIGIKA